MEGATQLDLLKERIEYNQNIFNDILYYEWENNDNVIYTKLSNPSVGDITYKYLENKMEEYEKISSKTESGNIVVDNVEYSKTGNETIIYETYEKVLNRLLNDSKYIALSLRFPFEDYSDKDLPRKYYNWQLRCCVEIYQGLGTEGIKSYAENGLSWTRDSDSISNGLKEEIQPTVGVIVEQEDEYEQI